jgi:hypothetical protein
MSISNRTPPNFPGDKCKSITAFKPRRKLKDALKSVAEYYGLSETEVIEDILDEQLKLLMDAKNIPLKLFEEEEKTAS